MIYKLNFIGGPADGQEITAFHPYFRLSRQGAVYEIEDPETGLENYTRWSGDGEVAIDLLYKPNATNEKAFR